MDNSFIRPAFIPFAATCLLLAGNLAYMPEAFGQDSSTGAGPPVWLNMDQAQLDTAYDQSAYALNMQSVQKRLGHQNVAALARLGEPEKHTYGDSPDEYLLVYRTERTGAPAHVYLHGGMWKFNTAEGGIAVAEPIINAGANAVLVNFSSVDDEGVSLAVLARQVRDATAWVYNNAEIFDANRERIFMSGHSSGGHLCGVLLVTDWARDYNLPDDLIKGGLCVSGMFDLAPVRLSSRNSWLKLSDDEEQLLSAQRYIEKLNAPIIIAYGTNETPEFQRQSRDFAAAVKASGKPVELLIGEEYNHFEILETFFNPYGLVGQALLSQMGLAENQSTSSNP
jgi:arylformamidase